jgi:hypothetical protein
MNLPWIQDRPPNVVYAFTYFGDRGNKRFRHGGIGGLIKKGYFATIVLPAGAAPEFDGSELDLYTCIRRDTVFDYYVRTPHRRPH